ncbi:hypothetical protein V5799_003468 [Amblyomma americanum]|uniref:TTI1 N-terminal TPR domain-containing protein n=1 Tax=Amblyomma americanum TaxID=6943 RepID=A0AAQ4D8V9_AMBAM
MPSSGKLGTSEALHEVKPLCIQLLKNQSKENVTILRRALEKLSDDACQELHQYLLLPLALVLKKENTCKTLVIETIATIRFVLEKTCVNDEKLFNDIFLQLLIVVTTIKDSLQVSATSEELKLEFCSALKTLVKSALPRVILQLYDVGFRLRLSHAVTILIKLAEKERNRQLQVASMECLAALACNNIDDVFKSKILFQKVGDAFAGFFPGISLAFTRVILNAENRSQNVTVHALKTWGLITDMVLGDAYLEAASPDDEVAKLGEKSPPEQVPIILRNKEWAKSTAEKLIILVDKVLPTLPQCGEKVKIAALDWARTLLLQCSGSLEILVPSVLQMVLSLCADDSERVSSQSHLVLDEVGNHMLVMDSLSLTEILEEDFHKTLSRFPRLLRMGSESEKLTLVKLLCGYLKIFRDKIAKILTSTAVSQKLLGVLFLLTELETRDMKLFAEQAAPLDFPNAPDLVGSCYRNQFMHFTDMRIFKEFTIICKLLGTYGDVTMLTDILYQKVQESASHRKQAILVLNNILQSLAEVRPSACAELEHSGFIG